MARRLPQIEQNKKFRSIRIQTQLAETRANWSPASCRISTKNHFSQQESQAESRMHSSLLQKVFNYRKVSVVNPEALRNRKVDFANFLCVVVLIRMRLIRRKARGRYGNSFNGFPGTIGRRKVPRKSSRRNNSPGFCNVVRI